MRCSIIIEFAYSLVGNGYDTCKTSKYTFTGTNDCDGWGGVSLNQCKEYCNNNAIPSGCTGDHMKNKRCSYIHYDIKGKWCHLIDSSCKPSYDVQLYEKIEKGL